MLFSVLFRIKVNVMGSIFCEWGDCFSYYKIIIFIMIVMVVKN